MGLQEFIALSIVAVVAVFYLQSFMRKNIAGPVSRALLKRGKVKWAMWINSKARR
jgi:uncharacterized protein (DUF486 family)